MASVTDPMEAEQLAIIAQEAISKYWALEKDPAALFEQLTKKEQEYTAALERLGFYSVWRLIYSVYYGLANYGIGKQTWQTQTITFYGENGELIDMSINEIRAFVDQTVSIVTRQRPAYQALASNTDLASLSQIEASNSLIHHFLESTFSEQLEKLAVLKERQYGKSFVVSTWDGDAGPYVDFEETVETEHGEARVQRNQRTGTFNISVKAPWEVISEPYRPESNKHNWRVVIDSCVNRFEAMARFPAKAAEIEQSQNKPAARFEFWPGTDNARENSPDECTQRTFYHAKTTAAPDGRKVIYINEVLVYDEPLDVSELPIATLYTGELEGTCFGIPNTWNMIPLEQLKNQILSDIATNIEAFGKPPIFIPESAFEMNLDALANGQQILALPTGAEKPDVLKFPEIPMQSFRVLEVIGAKMQSVSGLNGISRGESVNAVTSGAYAALYSQLSVEAQSELSASRTNMQEHLGNITVDYLKSYATAPQLVAIVGLDEQPYLQYFTKDQWGSIQRVRVKAANPLLNTIAGRMQVVETLKNWPGIPFKNPEQVIELLLSGTWKPLTNPTRAANLRIRYENEQFLKGTTIGADSEGNDTVLEVPVYPTDHAATHLWGHLELLDSPLGMRNPDVRASLMAHILEHIRVARTGDSYLANVLGLTPPEQQVQQLVAANMQPAKTKTPGTAPSDPIQRGAANTLSGPDDSVGARTPSAPKPAQPPEPNQQQNGSP